MNDSICIKIGFFVLCLALKKSIHAKYLHYQNNEKNYADMGIRTPVVGVKGRHDWPDYTISAVPSNVYVYP